MTLTKTPMRLPPSILLPTFTTDKACSWNSHRGVCGPRIVTKTIEFAADYLAVKA
jgi:hypothetical protein